MSLECAVCERDIRSGDHAACHIEYERNSNRTAKPTIEPGLDLRSAEIDRLRIEMHRIAESRKGIREERDALRAENERLTLADRQWADHVKRLAEQNERLRALHASHCGVAPCSDAAADRLRQRLSGQ